MIQGNNQLCRVIRTIGVILIVAAPGLAQSGDPIPAPVSIPPLNAEVAEFARSHLGQPVGNGICTTLAIEALRASGARRFPMNDPAGEYVWGEPVPNVRDVLPGDILQFRDAEFRGSRYIGNNRRETWRETYPHHTAIVVRTEDKGRIITICHQNVTLQGEDPAKVGQVREAILRMNTLQKGGQIRAYRPIPAETTPPAQQP